jgi:hypothetical protein
VSYSCNFCQDYGCNRCNGYSNGYSQINQALNNFRLPDAIAPEVTDPQELKKFFKNNGFIPYDGYSFDSQHSLLKFLDNLSEQSATLSGVINSIAFACFGGKSNIKKIGDIDFDFTSETDQVQTTEDISTESKKEFAAFLKTFDLSGYDWSGLKMNEVKSLKSNGNIFLEIEITQALGVQSIKFIPHPTKNCRYKIPTLFEKLLGISEDWSKDYLKKYPPRLLPVYPEYEKEMGKDGSVKSVRTVIHYKTGNRKFYGIPDWLSCLEPAFLEKKNFEYLLNASNNQFTPKMILEFEGEPGNSTALDDEAAKKKGYQSAMHRWRHTSTTQGVNNGGNPSGLLVLERPFGSKELFVHEPALNMNEKFYETIDRISSDKIILANAWSRKLAGIESSTGISNNSFIDDLKTRLHIIEHYQNIIDNGVLNKAIRFVAEMLGYTQFIEIGIESKNPFDHLLKAAQDTNLQQPVNQNNQQNPNGLNQ